MRVLNFDNQRINRVVYYLNGLVCRVLVRVKVKILFVLGYIIDFN